MISTSDVAPHWKSLDQNGSEITSTMFLGEWYLLYFYPEDDTPGCTKEACSFRDAFDQLSKKITILGVSSDSQESHQRFSNKFKLPFMLLSDTNKTLIKAFGTDGATYPQRTTFLIDMEGRVRKIYQNIDCEMHATDILQDLDSFDV